MTSLLKCSIAAGASALCFAGTATASPDVPHVRSSTPAFLTALARGRTLSPTLAAALDRLDATDVLVYVVDGRCPTATDTCLRLVPTAGRGTRIVRVDVRFSDARPTSSIRRADVLTGRLAHELAHALEIADRPEVVDGLSLDAFYREVGFAGRASTGRAFETDAAQRLGQQVEQEVRRAPRR